MDFAQATTTTTTTITVLPPITQLRGTLQNLDLKLLYSSMQTFYIHTQLYSPN